ncbi:CRISPR-associated protein Cse1 [Chelonobacter oris]|uniref:CRISPR-associated protein Cse1 n=1 Tax=Chelonobacter oris TaxID=505317 RepID=A0A0A3ALF4_9PAST|nr:CRISPR-associated protein Cse1 [Chelonobacter oris]
MTDSLLHNHEGFNLIDSRWIPIADHGLVGLRDVFSAPYLGRLGGNAMQKIALFKLLLAIAQAAYTPKDDDEWNALTPEELGQRCVAYLEKWYDRFELYGDSPFLQMPEISGAAIQDFGAVLPEIATGNTTVFTQTQREKPLSNADKALLILVLCSLALGGKKTDNRIVLSSGYRGKSNDKGKPSTGKAGSALGFMGLLHTFYLGNSILETIYCNLFTASDIQQMTVFAEGLGTPPWERMPNGENDSIAQTLKRSFIGRLLPMGRFCLLAENGLHYSEGIQHFGYKEEKVADPSVAINLSGKEAKVLWVDPEKRPWRELTALLSFIETATFNCPQLSLPARRVKRKFSNIGIWSGGLRVSSNAGEQYVSGTDDFVESAAWFDTEYFNQTWFEQWKNAMQQLDKYAKTVYSTVAQFYREQKLDGKAQATLAANQFWLLCEQNLQALIEACELITEDENSNSVPLNMLYRSFIRYAYQIYDQYTANQTARQLETWAKCRPHFAKNS